MAKTHNAMLSEAKPGDVYIVNDKGELELVPQTYLQSSKDILELKTKDKRIEKKADDCIEWINKVDKILKMKGVLPNE